MAPTPKPEVAPSTAGCSSCHGEPVTFVVSALARGAAIFGTNRRATYYSKHQTVLPSERRLVVLNAVDGLNHTATIEALLESGLQFHALSKRPAWRWGTIACWLSKYRLLQWAQRTPGFVVVLEEDVVLTRGTFCVFVARACARFMHVLTHSSSGSAGANSSASSSANSDDNSSGEWWPTVLQMSTYAEVLMLHSQGAARLVRGLRRHGIRRAADQQLFDPMQQLLEGPGGLVGRKAGARTDQRRAVLRYRGREFEKSGGPPPYRLARVANTGDIMSTPRVSWAEAALLRLQTVPAARRWPGFGNPPATDTIIFHDSGQYDGRHFARYAPRHEDGPRYVPPKDGPTGPTGPTGTPSTAGGTAGVELQANGMASGGRRLVRRLAEPSLHEAGHEAAAPFVALGVISASTPVGSRRRAAARDSWLRLAPATAFAVRFILRCGGLSAVRRTQLVQEDADGRVLCADQSISALEGRERGPLLALAWWMRHALTAFPSAMFIAKSDSDVFLHLPDIELQLRAIPNATAPFAWHGCFGFFSLVHLEEGHPHGPQYAFRGFAPTLGHAQHVYRMYAARVCTAADRAAGGGAEPLCAGPFPFAFGSFTALGRGAAAVLVDAPGFKRELGSLPTLIQAAAPAADGHINGHTNGHINGHTNGHINGHINGQWAGGPPPSVTPQGPGEQRQPLATEDVWLGACLWRFVGQAAPIALYSLASEQGHLYSDESSFRVRPYTGLWHNRNKFIGRPRLLYLFSQIVPHCSVRPDWVGSRLLQGVVPPRPRGVATAPIGKWYMRWSAFSVDGRYRRVACNSSADAPEATDLSDRRTLERMGISQQLGPASYIRPEAALRAAEQKRARARRQRRRAVRAGARVEQRHQQAAEIAHEPRVKEDWTRLYLWQKEGGPDRDPWPR